MTGHYLIARRLPRPHSNEKDYQVSRKRRKRRTLFDDLLDLPDFEMSDWNKLRYRKLLTLVPAQPEGLKIKDTNIVFGLDEAPETVIEACEDYLAQEKSKGPAGESRT